MVHELHFVICLTKKTKKRPLFPKNGSYLHHVFKNCKKKWVGIQTTTVGLPFELTQMWLIFVEKITTHLIY